MVGGIVVDRWIFEVDMVQVAVKDAGKCLGVDLIKNENSLAIKNGDTVWWQGHAVYWTPADKSMRDVKIPRLAVSYGLDDCRTPGRIAHNLTHSRRNATGRKLTDI